MATRDYAGAKKTKRDAGMQERLRGGNDSNEADQTLSDPTDGASFGQAGTLDRPDAPMAVDSSNPNYCMTHKRRGDAVIIAYENFGPTGPGRRGCAKHDAGICENAFMKLGYDVKTHWDLTKEKFIRVLENVRDDDHTDCDSLVVVFMSHGGVRKNQEFIWTYEKEVNTSELWKNFTPEKCPSLAGKPKMFFIQACRGDEVDKGVQLRKSLAVQTDGITDKSEEDYAIPLHADMLMMWASYPGMFAFKSSQKEMNGSVFLHFLSKVLTEDFREEDLSSMLIRVTREVSIQYESSVRSNDYRHKTKQVPQTVSTLVRKVHFLTK